MEIDESHFSEYKNQLSRLLSEQLVFGRIYRNTNECFVVGVLTRKATTHLEGIKHTISKRSMTFTDCRKKCIRDGLRDIILKHFKVVANKSLR